MELIGKCPLLTESSLDWQQPDCTGQAKLLSEESNCLNCIVFEYRVSVQMVKAFPKSEIRQWHEKRIEYLKGVIYGYSKNG